VTRVQEMWAGRARPEVCPPGVSWKDFGRFDAHLNGRSVADIARHDEVTEAHVRAGIAAVSRALLRVPRRVTCPTCLGKGDLPASEGW
jgi:hypothetical protein